MSCELCRDTDASAIWKNDFFYVIDAKDSRFPGFLRIISTKHIAEMSSLNDPTRLYLNELLITIEKAMLDVMRPDKINLAQFGNMVPHLHWHIIPRYKNDSHFPESPWGEQQRKMDTSLLREREELAHQLTAILPRLLEQIPLPKS